MSRLVKLPNGLLDGADLFNVVDIEELKGKQQNYLADKELVIGNIGHIPKILCDLIVSFQTAEGLKWQGKTEEAIEKISSGDLETILISIREETYGPRYYFEAECEHCKHLNKNQRINLDELEITYMPVEEMLDKSKRVFVLPKSQLEVELKPIYLRDIFEVIKITKNKQNELITSVIALSLKRIGDKTKITSKEVDELSMKDLMFLQEKLSEVKLEGFIDTNIDMTCSNCGKDFRTKLDVLSPDFFFPSKGSQNSSI